MNDRNEREWALFEAITDLSDETVRAALTAEPKSPKRALRKIALAACLAVVLLAGFFIGGSRWFAGVSAGTPSELLYDAGMVLVKINTDLPDGYEIHMQEEYQAKSPEEFQEKYEKNLGRTDYQSPDCPPIPEIQIVNSGGKRVFTVDFTGKSALHGILLDFNDEQYFLDQNPEATSPSTILEKNAVDKNGNHYLFYRNDYAYPPDEEPINDIETDYNYYVDLAGSKFSMFIVKAYGIEEEVRMLYDALNIRFVEDREEYITEQVAADLIGEWDGNWDTDARSPFVDEETALDDGTGAEETVPKEIYVHPEIDLSVPASKMSVFYRMINSVDYFNTVSTSFSYYFPNMGINEVQITIDSDLPTGRAYQSYLMTDTEHFYEDISDGVNVVRYFHETKTTRIDKPTVVRPEPVPGIEINQDRYYFDRQGYSHFSYRPNITNASEASWCLFPQEFAFGFLSNMTTWEITEETEVLGRKGVQLKGTAPEFYQSKFGIETFSMCIDKATGVILSFEGYDSSGDLINYVHVSEFVTDDYELTRNNIEKAMNQTQSYGFTAIQSEYVLIY